ncbi:DNA gyrase inhibitor YacG [Thiococcus pfennigii]|nr:DNA gyrase inhibitor YacG [Thiococcus pfennigii]MBK1731425.1 DNA gyrase inhibitor YacG [Thiococcus pfennigii]
MPPTPPIVSCPTCGKAVVWDGQARWRPFCGERCRLIDLGEWLSEERRLPAEDAPWSDLDANEDPAPRSPS